MRGRLLVLLLVLLAPRPARAEMSVEALGSAAVSGGDLEAARRRALDDAMRQAVDQVIAGLLAPEVRKQHDEPIRKRVLKRAKVYVTQHRVLDEGETGGVYQVHVVASVADGALRDDLRALGVPLLGEAAAPPPEPNRTPARPKVALVLIGEAREVETALGKALVGRGWQVLVAEPSEVPVDDVEAARRAGSAGGGVALVVSLATAEGGVVRGTRLHGAELQLAWRLVDAGAQQGIRLAEQTLADAAAGADLEAARRTVLLAVAETCARDVAFVLAQRWPAPARKLQGTLVVLRGVVRHAEVAQAQAALAKTAGVKKVMVFSMAAGQMYLLVVGGSAQSLGAALGALPARAVRVGEGMIDVDLLPPEAPAPEGQP